MKKTIMFMAVFLLSMFIVMPVHAEEAKYTALSDVEVLDVADSFIEGEEPAYTIEGNGTENVVITIDSLALKMVPKDPGAGKTIDAGWAGVRVYAPKGIKIEDLKKSKYDHGGREGDSTASWWDSRDSKTLPETQAEGQYFDFYMAVTEDILKQFSEKKSNFSYTYRMDWDGDKTFDQTVKVIFASNGITLQDLDTNQNKVLWNEEKYLETSKQVKLSVVVAKSQKDSGEVEPAKSYYYDKGAKVDQKELLAKLGVSSKYTLKGIYADETRKTAFDFSKPLENSTTIYVDYVLKTKEETNPATGDNLLTYVSLGVIALIGALGTSLYLRKVNE